MKFSTYEPAVNPNTLQNIQHVQQRVSRDLHVYGPQGGGEQWKALGQLAKVGLEMQQKAIDGKVLEANAEYNRMMSEGTAELMQKKEGEALNITDDYDKLQKNVLGEVKKKYGGYIGWGSGAEAFNAYTMRDDATRREHMMKYQMAETDKYHETQFNNQMATCMDIVGSGGYSDAAINAGMNRIEPLIRSRYANYGDEMIQQQMRSAKRGMVESALLFAVSMNDYTRMKDLCDKYKDAISPGKMASTLALIGKRQQEAQTLAFYDRMRSDLGHGATPDQVREWVRRNYEGKNRGGQSGHNLPLFKQWDDNWSDRPFSNGTLGTSGCAPTSMAMALSWATGKFISPVEVADYATQNGLVESDGVHGASFIPAVAEHYGVSMRQTSDKEEVINLLRQGVPVVAAHDPGMFTDYGHFLVYAGIDANGRVMINDPNGGVRHSDDATFSLDEIFNQESADYYVFDSLPDQREGDVGAVYNNEFYAMDLAEAENKAVAEYHRWENENKAAENVFIGQARDEMILASLQEGADPASIMEMADRFSEGQSTHVNAVLHEYAAGLMRSSQRSAARRARGEAEPSDAEVTGFFDSKIVYALDHGQMNLEQAREYVFKNEDISNSKKEKLLKMLDRYETGEKEFAYDWKNIESDVASLLGAKKSELGGLWGQIKKATLPEIRDYMHEHDGQMPPQQWVIDMCVEKGMGREIVRKGANWYSSDERESVTRAALYDKGVYSYSDNEDGTYSVTLMDSNGNPAGTYRISADQMMDIARGNLPASNYIE